MTQSAEQPLRIRSPRMLQERALLPGDGSQAAQTAVARAEQALDRLSVNFEDWIRAEVGKLHQARNAARAARFSEASLDALFSVSHDLKGQASTLGYPFAAGICASLCRLIDATRGGGRLPSELVDQHVDAVRAIVREGAGGMDHPKASVLTHKLCDVTTDYLMQLMRLARAR